MNHELPDVQAGFRKGRGTRDQIANIRWIMEKAREFQKNIYFGQCTLVAFEVLGKAEEAEIKLPTSTGSLKKQESSRKASISALLTMPKTLTVWITMNCGKF